MTKFAKETDLCAAFIAAIGDDWTAYAETGGFDILLVRADGFQIGVEAKLRLNAKVVGQVAESVHPRSVANEGPDCRAVLVPAGGNYDLAALCKLIGITVVVMNFRDVADKATYYHEPFSPRLPKSEPHWNDEYWHERAPAKRCKLPDYVPDTISGDAAPLKLTEWKIKAIKIAILLDRRGQVSRHDFKAIGINMQRWTDPYAKWLVRSGDIWTKGDYLPNFRIQHPVNYSQIEADYELWSLKIGLQSQGALL